MALSACGIPRNDQLLFLQQVTQENGSLDPGMTGGTDKGYSFGIGQWYNPKMKAKRVLELYPEKATLEWQVAELAKSSCEKYKKYPGNIRRAIVHHNCPSCANHNAVPKACGGVDSYRWINAKVGWSCYFQDEVNGDLAKKRFE